jgi:hypothetical protein
MFMVHFLNFLLSSKYKKGISQENYHGKILKIVAPAQGEPQADPSGGIPEENLVIVGGDTLLVTLLLKTFQWDKMWKRKTRNLILTLWPSLMCMFIPCFYFNKKKN